MFIDWEPVSGHATKEEAEEAVATQVLDAVAKIEVNVKPQLNEKGVPANVSPYYQFCLILFLL